MRKLRNSNINTSEYWNTVYENEITRSIERIAYERFHFSSEMMQTNSIVLDVACGTGDFLRYLSSSRPDCTLYGCDFSDIAIRSNREKDKNVTFDIVDIREISTAYTMQFDVVTCFETLEHVQDPQKLLNDLLTLVKENGLLIITTPFNDMVYGGDEHLFAFTFEDFLEFEKTQKSIVISLFRYSERFKNMCCVIEKRSK